MSITNYQVRFMRKVNPAQYENAEAEVTFAGVVEGSQDAAKEAAEALGTAKKQVLASLGKAPKSEPDTAETKVESGDETAPPAKRGRPAGSKSKKSEPAEAKKSDDKKGDDKPEASEDDDSWLSGPTEPEPEEISDKELQDAAKATALQVTSAVVKEYMEKEFGIKLLGKLPMGRRREFLDGLEKLKKDKK